MGRVKIQMKKIENKDQRNIAFAKRKCGIIKKAYELYTLCDIQTALILFSPAGKLFLFEAKTRIEETIKKYIDLPCYRRGSLHDEPFIRRWIENMRLESSMREKSDDGVRKQVRSKDNENEIENCKVQLANVEQQLGYFLKDPNQWESMDEIEYQEKILQQALDKVRSQKQYLELKSKLLDVSAYLGV